jgi:serine protease Do
MGIMLPRAWQRDNIVNPLAPHICRRRRGVARLHAALALIAALLAGPGAMAATPDTCDIQHVVARSLPSIVSITVVRILHDDKSEPGKPPAVHLGVFVGSGFIVDPSGLIVTNKHVIEDAAVIKVTFQNRKEVLGQLYASAAGIDLAVLKVNLPVPLPTVSFGNSDGLEIGQRVIAIGNPLGVGTSVTTGVVSAQNRDLMRTPFDDYIQTDASINPGNSGGPLFDCSGRVIGVDTYLLSNNSQLGSIGLGFALPSNDVSFVVGMLRNPDLTAPNWIGLRLQDLTEELAAIFGRPNVNGAIVTGLDPDSPASAASLGTGDIVMALDGHALADSRAIQRAVVEKASGDPIVLSVWRDGRAMDVTLRGKPWPHMMAQRGEVLASAESIEQAENAGLGLHVTDISDEDRKRYNLANATGVLIDNVVPGSQAETMNFHAGDVIEQIGEQKAPTLAQVTSKLMIGGASPGNLVALLVREKSGSKWRTLWVGHIDAKDLVAALTAGGKVLTVQPVAGRPRQ